MAYVLKHRGLTVKEFSNQGELDAYLADRVFEWTEQGLGYEAHLGADYVELVTDRGNTVTLTFSLVSDNPFTERGLFK